MVVNDEMILVKSLASQTWVIDPVTLGIRVTPPIFGDKDIEGEIELKDNMRNTFELLGLP